MPATIIYDLDGTVICSKHRQLTGPDGSLDLAHWREHCTTEKIMADKLLPLAETMRNHYRDGHRIIICTARIFTNADLAYLQKHNLHYHHLISRHPVDVRPDAEYKVARLNELAIELGYKSLAHMSAIMYDDNISVIKAMFANRVICLNATFWNEKLRKAA